MLIIRTNLDGSDKMGFFVVSFIISHCFGKMFNFKVSTTISFVFSIRSKLQKLVFPQTETQFLLTILFNPTRGNILVQPLKT